MKAPDAIYERLRELQGLAATCIDDVDYAILESKIQSHLRLIERIENGELASFTIPPWKDLPRF